MDDRHPFGTMGTSPARALTAILMLALLAGCGTDADDATLRASGTIEVEEIRLAAQTAGELLRLDVDEGSRVHAGDTLGVIGHEELRLQRRQAEAAAEAAAARLALLRAGARPEDLAAGRAQLRQAEVSLEQARADERRLHALVEAGSVTRKQYDDAAARLAVAEAAHEATEQALRKLQQLARPEELRAAAAQYEQALASVDLLAYRMDRAHLTAPITGTVTTRVADPGELVAPGATVLTLADLRRAYLRVYVPEPALGRLRLGQSVTVYTDAHPEQAVEGTITFIASEAEFTPKNVQTKEERVKLVYEVKVDLPNPAGRLRPGMYADAILPLTP